MDLIKQTNGAQINPIAENKFHNNYESCQRNELLEDTTCTESHPH